MKNLLELTSSGPILPGTMYPCRPRQSVLTRRIALGLLSSLLHRLNVGGRREAFSGTTTRHLAAMLRAPQTSRSLRQYTSTSCTQPVQMTEVHSNICKQVQCHTAMPSSLLHKLETPLQASSIRWPGDEVGAILHTLQSSSSCVIPFHGQHEFWDFRLHRSGCM